MIQLLAAATLGMACYTMWMLVFRLRKDRVLHVRERTRGKYAFRPKQRIRFLLQRSFDPPSQREEWEQQLVSRLAAVPVRGGARRAGERDRASLNS